MPTRELSNSVPKVDLGHSIRGLSCGACSMRVNGAGLLFHTRVGLYTVPNLRANLTNVSESIL